MATSKVSTSDVDVDGASSPVARSETGEYLDKKEDQILMKLGYKRELYRGFSTFMSFAFCFTAVGVLASLSTTWSLLMGTGGPSVSIWGWLICSVFTITTGFAMAEVCSSYPSAGSVYHWAAVLAPPKYSALSCYITGWFNFLGNAAGDATFAWGFASVCGTLRYYSSIDDAGQPNGTPFTTSETVGLAIGICFVWATLNILRVDQQGWINNFAAIWQVLSTFIIIIVVLAMPERDPDIPTNWPWITSFNTTGFDDTKYFGYICLIGLLSSLFAFSGYEAGAHMAEETTNASQASPLSVVRTCVMVAVCGFSYILGMMYATPSVNGMKYKDWVTTVQAPWVHVNGAYGTPEQWIKYDDPATQTQVMTNFSNIDGTWMLFNYSSSGVFDNPNDDGYYTAYYDSTDGSTFIAPWDTSVDKYLNVAMAAVADADDASMVYFAACGHTAGMGLTVLLAITLFFVGISSLTVTTRIGYAMARDGAFPFSDSLAYIWPKTQSPVTGVILVLVLDILFLLLGLASSIALTAILSICVIGYQISYAIPLILRLTPFGRKQFHQSYFNLGKYSIAVHAVASLWLVFTSIIMFWPAEWPVLVNGVDGVGPDDDNMNYTIVIVAVTFVVTGLYWLVYARYAFKGPLGRNPDLHVRPSETELINRSDSDGGRESEATPSHNA